MSLAERARRIDPSVTLKISARASAMKREGKDIIDLSVGEPDFATPENIKEAGKMAIDTNFTKYTPSSGILELKEAIVEKFRLDHQVRYSPSQILVSAGAKMCLYTLCQALLDEGDEVIIPSPYWVSYPEMTKMAGAEPVYVQTEEENNFLLTPTQFKDHVSTNTKAIFLNNPVNPTGAGYSRHQLMEIAEVALQEDIYVIADEIYEKLIYDDFSFCCFASLGDDVKAKTIVINGVSKAYSMTGWRIGYAAGPEEIISAMSKIQSHSTSNPCSIAQKASVEAILGPQGKISQMRAEFQKRRNYLIQKLGSIPHVSCSEPQGAFYLFPNLSHYYNKVYKGREIRNSHGLAFYLLNQAQVAIVPGAAFGDDRYIRISYATSMDLLEKAMERICGALQLLKTPSKVKKMTLANTNTRSQQQVSLEEISQEMRNALVAEAEAHLHFHNYYEWNANISGVVVQLRTNIAHLYNFWQENWYPAQLETDLEPHAIVYAVGSVTGRQGHAFYNSDTKTAVLFNQDFYQQLRSIALGVVADVVEQLFGVHLVRGMGLEINGRGVLLLAPGGTGKFRLLFDLLKCSDKGRLLSLDALFVRYNRNQVWAENGERKLYLPTRSVESYEKFAPLFDRGKTENVVSLLSECTDLECKQKDICRLDRGSPYCFKASKSSYALLDPYWLGGTEKYCKRSPIDTVLLLKRDQTSPPLVPCREDDAVHILESGGNSGLPIGYGQESETGSGQFFNPHLLVKSSRRLEWQKQAFIQLFQGTKCYQVNTGASREQLLERLKEIL